MHFLVVTVAMTESSTGEKLIKAVFNLILLNWVSALVIDHEAVVFEAALQTVIQGKNAINRFY